MQNIPEKIAFSLAKSSLLTEKASFLINQIWRRSRNVLQNFYVTYNFDLI